MSTEHNWSGYHRTCIIGQGTYGRVYLYENIENKHQTAMKQLFKNQLDRYNRTYIIQRERNALEDMKGSDFVIKLWTSWQDNDNFYMIVDFLPNGNLYSSYKMYKYMSYPAIRHYTAEIILALEYLRTKNIVHRELKPENCHLDKNKHIKIADFGTYKTAGEKQGTVPYNIRAEGANKHAMRSRGVYVAPEVYDKEGKAAFCNDLWSLGCMLYELNQGGVLFEPEPADTIVERLKKANILWVPQPRKNLQDLVKNLVVVKPTSRLGSSSLDALKKDKFYASIDWEAVRTQTPPDVKPDAAYEDELVIGDDYVKTEKGMGERFKAQVEIEKKPMNWNDFTTPPVSPPEPTDKPTRCKACSTLKMPAQA